jgi:hypothetical protein
MAEQSTTPDLEARMASLEERTDRLETWAEETFDRTDQCPFCQPVAAAQRVNRS